MADEKKNPQRPKPQTEKKVPLRESVRPDREQVSNGSAEYIRKAPLSVSERVPVPPPKKK